MYSIVGYCIVFCLIQCKINGSAAQLEAKILSPLVYNAYLSPNQWGTFTCIANDSDDIRWIIDGVVHNTQSTRKRMIKVRTQDNSQNSTITIYAIPVNQHIARIKCRAYHLSPRDFQFVESVETAQFNIQGLLDMPPNISYSNYNATHNLIKWQEPETLNITNIEPDIESYTVCMNITDECVNVTATDIIIPKYTIDLLINVSAWNIVGESVTSAELIIGAQKTALLANETCSIQNVSISSNDIIAQITFILSLGETTDLDDFIVQIEWNHTRLAKRPLGPQHCNTSTPYTKSRSVQASIELPTLSSTIGNYTLTIFKSKDNRPSQTLCFHNFILELESVINSTNNTEGNVIISVAVFGGTLVICLLIVCSSIFIFIRIKQTGCRSRNSRNSLPLRATNSHFVTNEAYYITTPTVLETNCNEAYAVTSNAQNDVPEELHLYEEVEQSLPPIASSTEVLYDEIAQKSLESERYYQVMYK